MTYSVAYALPEGTRVAITEDDGAVWFVDAALPADDPHAEKLQAWVAAGGVITPYVAPPAPVFTRIPKAEVWRRLTDEEAETVDAALQAAPLRLRRVFESAQFLDTDDADYPALRAGVVAALGEQRADEVLAPTY